VIDRQARNLPLDAHLHTDLSPDSDVPIDAYAEQAVERGIDEIAITDHVDFEPGTPAYAATTFGERECVVRTAAERWGPRGVAIRFGVELTYDRRFEADLREHVRRHPYDFVIGSVHVYRSSPYAGDRVAGFVAGRSLREVVAPYFDEAGGNEMGRQAAMLYSLAYAFMNIGAFAVVMMMMGVDHILMYER